MFRPAFSVFPVVPPYVHNAFLCGPGSGRPPEYVSFILSFLLLQFYIVRQQTGTDLKLHQSADRRHGNSENHAGDDGQILPEPAEGKVSDFKVYPSQK